MARRQHLTLMVALAVVCFLSFSYFISGASPASSAIPFTRSHTDGLTKEETRADFGVSQDVLNGGAIAPKLENATIKAELGRSSWRLLHTMMARFPEKPTEDDSVALKTYMRLFARLYPCGDCASHFQKLLAQYPPQVSSRNAAAGWACFVHNQVNERLHKPIFDCNNIGDFYDCGCGDEDKKKMAEHADAHAEGAGATIELE